MAFKDLDLATLENVAGYFGSEPEYPETVVSDSAKKKLVIAALTEDGVNWTMYKEAFEPEDVDTGADGQDVSRRADTSKVVDPAEGILLKMERENGTYEVRGYRFTRDHPFSIVTEDDANFICSSIEGFRIALPSEAKAYYGG